MAGRVILEKEYGGRLAILTIANPPVNVLTREVRAAFGARLDELRAKGTVETLVLKGTGAGFSAGADLSGEILPGIKNGEEAVRQFLHEGHAFMDALASFPAEKIALIHGFSMGAGLELALACDIRYAVSEAMLALPEVKFGLWPGWGGTVRSRELMGQEAARRFYGSGEGLLAEAACGAGLVSSVFDTIEDALADIRLAAEYGRFLAQFSGTSYALDEESRTQEINEVLERIRYGDPEWEITRFLNKGSFVDTQGYLVAADGTVLLHRREKP